jgi:putative glycosyltransferase
MTGLSYATGDLVFLIDSDLEERPELLIDLYQELSKKDGKGAIDVVYALQERRKGAWFEKISGDLFWRLFNWLTGLHIPYNPMTSRLMTRRYVQSLLQHKEKELFLVGLMNLTGYRQEPHYTQKGHKGQSTYTLKKKLSLFINAITSFSHVPLIFIFVFGTAVSLLSLACIFWVLFSKLVLGITYLSGWSSLLLITCFFGGLNLAAIGAVGIYLGKVFVEVKNRPSIIKDVLPKGLKAN